VTSDEERQDAGGLGQTIFILLGAGAAAIAWLISITGLFFVVIVVSLGEVCCSMPLLAVFWRHIAGGEFRDLLGILVVLVILMTLIIAKLPSHPEGPQQRRQHPFGVPFRTRIAFVRASERHERQLGGKNQDQGRADFLWEVNGVNPDCSKPRKERGGTEV